MEKQSSQLTTSFLSRHRAALLVLGSQLMAAVLHALARLLETRTGSQDHVHPFTILQVRLLITGLGCSAYLGWWAKTPDYPLGLPELRPLLALRALGGLFGACGFYVSISYLSLSEATALNFLAPLGTLILTRYLDNGRITITDGVSCAIALVSVVLVLQPEPLFDKVVGQEASGPANGVSLDPNALLKGTLAGIVAVAGGIVALSSIHRIGTRTHPLLSVNYFSWVVFFVTTIASLFLPGVIWPTDLGSWCLLVLLGLVGFCMEYLLTAGLGSDRSPSATIMIYSQVLWAILLDWLIWHSSVNWLTIVGCFGVIISLTTVSLVNEPQGSKETVDYDLVAESELEDVNTELGGRQVA
ncbi:membrane protein [Apiospora arundinis]|uniref:Membrane protein n=1 Tax=Apiospora arundinis TaxID=335852 RepID=A0ABR2JGI9_9PEZI